MPPLRNLPNDLGGLTRNDGKAGNDHIGRHDRPVENLNVVLENGKLANGAVPSDLHMVSNCRSLDDSSLANKYVVSYAQRHVCEGALVHAARWTQQDAPCEEAVSAYGNSSVVGWGAARGRCGDGTSEVAADHDFGLDDGFAAEHDVLGSDEDGFTGDFVTCVLLRCVSV
ncbi:hypothetical protein HG531_007681 [Fusarium graminearum]|nr:hypothetical protein HG531_007681 [Fusarium graminearum]